MSSGKLIDPWSEIKQNLLHYTSASVTSGSDTTATDQFRQGVELIQQKHYYMGSVKIHSGYPEHKLPQQVFGQSNITITDDNWYDEIDSFRPEVFISLNPAATSSFALRPFNGTNYADENVKLSEIYDGVLEPLVIRKNASYFSVESPTEFHNINASLQMGNIDDENYSDLIQDEIEFATFQVSAFVDSAIKNRSITLSSSISPQKIKSSAFTDTRLSSSIRFTDNMDSSIQSAIRKLGSIADGYVHDNFKKTPSGFTYDTHYGTDSIAFGNMTYLSCSVSSPP
jgi:hypothetical protein